MVRLAFAEFVQPTRKCFHHLNKGGDVGVDVGVGSVTTFDVRTRRSSNFGFERFESLKKNFLFDRCKALK